MQIENSSCHLQSRRFYVASDCLPPCSPAVKPPGRHGVGWECLEFKKRTERVQGAPSEQQEEVPERENVLVCRQCRLHITEENQRISVDGAHRHSFVNPYGQVFDIGCFGAARGGLGAGPASGEFTWFPGYSWRVVICAGCMTHLGWIFQSPGAHHFFGLILDCLVSSD